MTLFQIPVQPDFISVQRYFFPQKLLFNNSFDYHFLTYYNAHYIVAR